MNRCVALLRGINVGKAKRLAMADLRRVVESLGYTDVRTLLNSGNVVFDTRDTDLRRVAARIEEAVAAHAGFVSRVIVVDRALLATVVRENDLAARTDNPSRLLVAFVRDAAVLDGLAPLAARDWSPEALHVGTRAAYLWCPEGVVDARVVDASWRVLGEGTTTRNWATVLKLCPLAGVSLP